MKKKSSNKRHCRPVFEELEPRLLLSADVGEAITLLSDETLTPSVAEIEIVDDTDNADSDEVVALTRHELVFVDSAAPDSQTLVDDLLNNRAGGLQIEVVVLDSALSGIDQITETLALYQDLDAVHIISHGTDAAVQLGNASLDLDTLVSEANRIERWGNAFAPNGDLLLYGCNLAGSQQGQSLIDELSMLTGADVAASEDLTGSLELGGDWELEYQAGQVETAVALSSQAQDSWSGVLATFVVNSIADTVDANPGDGIAEDASGNTTLRAAIMEANALAGADIIDLSAGNYTLTIGGTGEDNAATGDLDITSDLTLTGAGAGATTIDGGGLDRVFDIPFSGNANISGVTITNGSEATGGGIKISGGGGGGRLTLTDAILSNNSATNRGGAIFNDGVITLSDVEISGTNTASEGGGLFNTEQVTLDGVTISGNTANSGAGIYNSNQGNLLSLTNVTISGNTATVEGGGLYTAESVALTNVTVASNSAPGGGGIFSTGGQGDAVLKNTILASNTGGNANIALSSLGNNIDSDGTAALSQPTDQSGTLVSPLNVMLGSLQNNGGPTATHALLPGSPAINAGTTTGAPTVDQRGLARDAIPDVGAFEFNPTANTTLVVTTTADILDAPDTTSIAALLSDPGADGRISLREAIEAANATANSGGPDRIYFNIIDPLVGGAHTIQVGNILDGNNGPLPVITGAVIIDGTSESDFAGTPIIELDGTATIATHGLEIGAGGGGTTIRGLVINRFDAHGVYIHDADGSKIESNFIGTDVTGTLYRGNLQDGINITNSDNNTIGGTTTAQRNVISGNLWSGIGVVSGSAGNTIQGNLIGTDETGSGLLGNALGGVWFANNANNNIVGGTVPGTSNIIAFNTAGVVITQNGTDQNAIRGNSIHSHIGLGIDLNFDGPTVNDPADVDGNENNFLNYPVLTSAVTNEVDTITIDGSITDGLPNTDFEIDFFYTVGEGGEGANYLGSLAVSTDASGNVSFNNVTFSGVAVPDSAFITATATVVTGTEIGNTSEFSEDFQATLPNTPPVAVDDAVSTDEDTPLLISIATLLANDSDADFDALTISGFTQPANGAVVDNGDGTYTYTPNAQFNGADSFTYTVDDSNGGTDTATVNITVNALNDAPSATITQGAYAVAEDISLVLHGTGLSVADVDAGSAAVRATLSVGEGTLNVEPGTTGVTVADSGSTIVTLDGTVAQINDLLAGNFGATVIYDADDAPAPGTPLTLSIDDLGNSGAGGPLGGSDVALFNTTAVNDAPSATITQASYAVAENTPLALHGTGLSVGDPDAGSNPVQATLDVGEGTLTVAAGATGVTVTGSGSNTVTLNGTLTQINNLLAGASGATIIYDAVDAPSATTPLTLAINDLGNSGTGGPLLGSDSATFNINSENDPPLAADNNYTTNEDVAAGGNVLTDDTGAGVDSDPDGDALSVNTAPVVDVNNGTLVLNADGTFTYTPNANFNGTDSFTYEVSDGNGGIAQATVALTVTAANDTPTSSGIGNVTVNEDAPNTVIDLFAAFADTEDADASLTYTITNNTNPSLFTATNIDGVAGTLTLDYGANQNGSADITVRATDTGGLWVETTFSVTVNPVNDAPTAVNDSYTTSEDTALTATLGVDDLLLNDADLDGDALTVNTTPVVGPTNGVLVLNANGTFTYSPNANFNGTDSFTYEVSDGNGGATQATVTITVTPLNNAPVAANDGYAVNEDNTLSVVTTGVLGNDSDTDGDALSAVLVSGPGSGALTLNADGSFIYTPNPNFQGTDAFAYKANDGVADSNIAIVTITVNAVNDATALDLDADNSAGQNGADFTANFGEGAGPVLITDADALLADVDSATLTSLTVTITNPFDGAAEILAADTSGTSITASYDPAAGALTLSGVDSVANYQRVLRTISYQNTASGPNAVARTITFVASDGSQTSNTAVATVVITANAAQELSGLDTAVPETDTLPAPTVDGGNGASPGDESASLETTADDNAGVDGEGIPEDEGRQMRHSVTNPPAETAQEPTGDPTAAAPNAQAPAVPAPAPAAPEAAVPVEAIKFERTPFDQGAKTKDTLRGFGETPLRSPHMGVIRSPLQASGFINALDQVREEFDEDTRLQQTVVGSTIAMSTGLSVGYVMWLARGGVLLTSVLSSLPAWRLIDPLPVLASLGRDYEDEEDDESLESLVETEEDDTDSKKRLDEPNRSDPQKT